MAPAVAILPAHIGIRLVIILKTVVDKELIPEKPGVRLVVE